MNVDFNNSYNFSSSANYYFCILDINIMLFVYNDLL